MDILSFTVGPVSTECHLAIDRSASVAFLVDPGDDAARILAAIEKEKAELKYVVLTHGHFDHVMAADEVIRKTGAELVVCKDEVPALSDPELAGYNSFGIPGFVPLKADVVVADGDSLAVGGLELKFIRTPGHTTGSMCIIVGDVIFSGDTLFAGTCGRCDLPGGDYAEMLASLKLLAELPGDYKIYSGHGEPTILSIERQYNPYMREAARR